MTDFVPSQASPRQCVSAMPARLAGLFLRRAGRAGGRAGGPISAREVAPRLLAVTLLLAGVALATLPAARAQGPQAATASPAATAAASAEEAANIEAAKTAARGWLERFDAGDAGVAWDRSAAAFRKAVTRDKWIADLKSLRETVGAIQGRESKDARFTRSLPGAPEAAYVLIQNAVRYEKKGTGIETITMVREDDGVWRMAGYFVR